MTRVRSMMAAEVCAVLSLSEFNRLCAAVDEKLPPSEWVQNGPDTVRTLGKLVSKKFGVVRVERVTAEEINVMLDLGMGKIQWFGIKADEKRKKGAAA